MRTHYQRKTPTISLYYKIKGAKFVRLYDARTERREAWVIAATLIENGISVRITERNK